jgi:hypothetical protein
MCGSEILLQNKIWPSAINTKPKCQVFAQKKRMGEPAHVKVNKGSISYD